MLVGDRLNERRINIRERNAAFMIMIQATDQKIFIELYRLLTADSSTHGVTKLNQYWRTINENYKVAGRKKKELAE